MNIKNVLLISVLDFKNKSTTNLNVDDKQIQQSISFVMDSDIQPIYGSCMYDQVLTYKYNLLTNPTGTTSIVAFDNLITASINAIINSAILDLTTEQAYKSTNLGITKKGTANDTAVDITELKFLINSRKSKKDFYLEELNKWLIINSSTYIQYQTNSTTPLLYPNHATKYRSAFATGKSNCSVTSKGDEICNGGASYNSYADLSNYYTMQQVYNTGQTYNRTYIDNLSFSGVSLDSYWTSSQTILYVNAHSGSSCDLTGYWNSGETIIYVNAHSGSSCDLTGYWNSGETIIYVNAHSGGTVDLSNYYNKQQVYNTAETYTKAEVNSLTGITTNSYTKIESNANFLSANTSFYTQAQSNGNFLSANTSFYTQAQTNNNFLSANTSFYTQAQSNSNFLSANTSFYTKAQSNNNFLSANTTGNWLSANTSYYTQAQSNSNFLSANTSYYTQAQANSNFVSGLTLTTNYYNKTQIDSLITGVTSGGTCNLTPYWTSATTISYLQSNYYTQSQIIANYTTTTDMILLINQAVSGATMPPAFFVWDIL